MRASDRGININKAELAALLEFTGDDSQFRFVHFCVNGNAKIVASASDGKRSVEFTSEADTDAQTGEWRCDREFIEACRRLVDPNQTQVLLKVTEKGMREVLIIGIDDESERGRYKVPSDAVSTQVTMAGIHKEIGGSNLDSATKRSWFAMSAKTLKPLIAVERAAAGCPITIYAGKTFDAPVNFEARSIGGHWLGAFKPSTVTAAGDEAPDGDDDDDAPPGTQSAPRALELVAPLATEKKRRAKASKKPAKKVPSKRAPRATTGAEAS